MLTLNELHIMLAIQHRSQNAYGVTIREYIANQIGRSLSLGALYSVLNRLEDRKLVTSRDGGSSPERGGRPKRLYSLTGEGRQTLLQVLSDIDRLRPTVALPA